MAIIISSKGKRKYVGIRGKKIIPEHSSVVKVIPSQPQFLNYRGWWLGWFEAAEFSVCSRMYDCPHSVVSFTDA